jgi:hypothetical protein
MIELNKLKMESIHASLEMAKRYRLLNEPDAAESICLDILAVEPTHQEALITLILALTDKFSDSGLNPAFGNAREMVTKLDSQYCQSYYTGIIFERRAKYHLKKGALGSGPVAYEWFSKAMTEFENALESCDPDNQDAVLRWNSCARFINDNAGFQPNASQQVEFLLDAYETPH